MRLAVLGTQAEQVPDRGARARSRAQLENLAEQHQDDDHRCRFEVDGNLAHHAERVGEQAWRQCRDDAVAERGAHAERDEREHVQVPVHQ